MTAHGGIPLERVEDLGRREGEEILRRRVRLDLRDDGRPGRLLDRDEQRQAGRRHFQMQKGQGMGDMPEGWSVFIAVDDLDKRLKALKKAGGRVDAEPWVVPGVGRIAMVADAGGADQGWMEPAEGLS